MTIPGKIVQIEFVTESGCDDLMIVLDEHGQVFMRVQVEREWKWRQVETPTLFNQEVP